MVALPVICVGKVISVFGMPSVMTTTEFFWQAQQTVHCRGLPLASVPERAQLAATVPDAVSAKAELTQELE
jgi:hypothetical protein